MMYEVWSEGYRITGNDGTATLEGRIEADNFHDACVKLLGERLDKGRDELSVWGCRLFDNETEARVSFG
jgi:hypothetical protein